MLELEVDLANSQPRRESEKKKFERIWQKYLETYIRKVHIAAEATQTKATVPETNKKKRKLFLSQ